MNNKTGMETLRHMVKFFNNCAESFLDKYSIEELIKIYAAWEASEWDFYPDCWTADQVAGALVGIVPQWDENEKPIQLDKASEG